MFGVAATLLLFVLGCTSAIPSEANYMEVDCPGGCCIDAISVFPPGATEYHQWQYQEAFDQIKYIGEDQTRPNFIDVNENGLCWSVDVK